MVVGAFVVVVAAMFYYWNGTGPSIAPDNSATLFEPKNATYTIENLLYPLKNGVLEQEAAPGSASKIITRIFGEPALGDLDSDGKEDSAVMLTQDSGGSGTFFYVSSALNTNTGARGTNSLLLGDRIAPQNISIKDGVIEVNYAERRPGESFAIQPSLGVTKRFKLDRGNLFEYIVR